MKRKKLMERIRRILDADLAEQERARRSLHQLLGELRRKQRDYERRLAQAASDEEREELQRKLEAMQAQRRKGVIRLRTLGKSAS